MKIIQHTPTITPHDAVSDNVLHLDKILKEKGYKTEIFADNIDEYYKGLVKNSSKFSSDNEDLVLLHFSIGSDFYRNIKKFRGKKIIFYHNITPPKFFIEYSAPAFEYSSMGLRQLKEIQEYIDGAIADSLFNADELVMNGYKNPDVLPLYYDLDKRVKANEQAKEDESELTQILFVGRIAPNKKQEDIVKAFYFYHKYFNPKSKLYLVGGYSGMEFYKNKIEVIINKLKLDKFVELTGKISDEELAHRYKNADLYLSMSEHEGFCAPVLECMSIQLPILAYYNSGALPETAGKGAVYFTKKKYFEIAGIMDYILTDSNLKEKIKANQEKELERFSNKKVEEKFWNIIKTHTKNDK